MRQKNRWKRSDAIAFNSNMMLFSCHITQWFHGVLVSVSIRQTDNPGFETRRVQLFFIGISGEISTKSLEVKSISLRFLINSVCFLILTHTEIEFELEKPFLWEKSQSYGSYGKRMKPKEKEFCCLVAHWRLNCVGSLKVLNNVTLWEPNLSSKIYQIILL